MSAVIVAVKAELLCRMCSRTVEGLAIPEMRLGGSRLRAKPGQRCRQCGAPMDASYVLALRPEAVPSDAADANRAA